MLRYSKKWMLVLAISAVVIWGLVPTRLTSIHTFNPIREVQAQQGGGNPMNIMMLIMMLMMFMSLAKNNNLQGKQANRANDAALRLMGVPNNNQPAPGVGPYPGAPGGPGAPGYPPPPGYGYPPPPGYQVPPGYPAAPNQKPGININIPWQ